MSEFALVSKPALADRAPIAGKDITLEALPEGHVILIMGKPGDETIKNRIVPLSDGTPHAVRAAGPGQWFIVGDQPKTQGQLEALFAALGTDVYGVDQSAGRVRIHLYGAGVESVLSKGTAVDLAMISFPVGWATTTLIGHISTHVTRTGEHAFELMVLRGFAESLWDDLVQMSLEFQ
jgi:sarcosine oxidase subunit gamma